jgi:alkaline phosphatase
MDTLPETAFVTTFSNDAQVTDSAPSMAAYMTGVKMNNEVLSMSSETVATNASKDTSFRKDAAPARWWQHRPVPALRQDSRCRSV